MKTLNMLKLYTMAFNAILAEKKFDILTFAFRLIISWVQVRVFKGSNYNIIAYTIPINTAYCKRPVHHRNGAICQLAVNACGLQLHVLPSKLARHNCKIH